MPTICRVLSSTVMWIILKRVEIVLLLGDKFKQSFSEEELKANYGYPKETDDELAEWDCDNM